MFKDRDFYKSENCVVIIGGGPSHCDIDLKDLIDVNFIAVNSSCRKVFEIATPRDILYFTDFTWCEKYINLVKSWPGMVMTFNRNSKIKYQDLLHQIDLNDIVDLFEVKSESVKVSSGHIAACLAAYLGTRKIVLIGFECGIVNGRSHGHEDYSTHTVGVFKDRYIPDWEVLAPRFKELGVDVVNATPESYLKCFEHQPLDQALNS